MHKFKSLVFILLLVSLLTACGGEHAEFYDDMAEVRVLVQTAYDDDMRKFTPQEHALGLKLISADRHDFDLYSDEQAVKVDHHLLFMDYADFARGNGDADFIDTLDKYADE
ncbi:hypothetical protein DHX103_14520 [Planococcus sp. X10-3]|uniref:hypothetical protein n=1 Tax=Planococcus sp. X10-3 TaxID=3061240 RepID=UPI003BB1107B